MFPPGPPAGTTVAVPLFPPLHNTFVPEIVAVNAVGCVGVKDAVVVHPPVLVIVTV